MLLLNKLLLAGIVVSSLVIFFQDLKEKHVSIWILCVFSGFILFEAIVNGAFTEKSVLLNLLFCLIQFLIITLYFSLKARRFVKIFESLFGWADIWVTLSLAFSFYWVNYVFFLTFSYTVSLVLYILARIIFGNISEKIPLAGMLCFLYAVVKVIFFYWDMSTLNDQVFYLLLNRN